MSEQSAECVRREITPADRAIALSRTLRQGKVRITKGQRDAILRRLNDGGGADV